MKKMIIVFLLIYTVFNYADNYNTYNLELLSQYLYGTAQDVFGHNTGYSTDPYGPSAIGVSNDGKYYIFDNWEKKIVVLGSDFKVIDEIMLNDFISDGRWLSPLSTNINSHQNGMEIIGYASRQAFRVLDNGVDFFYQDFETYTTYNYLGNVLFFMKNSSLFSIPNPGPDPEANNRKILNASQTRELFNEPAKYGLEGVTLKNGKLFVDGVLQTRDYKTYYEYWRNKHNDRRLNLSKLTTDSEVLVTYKPSYIGHDYAGNVYWQNYSAVAACTKDGYLFDFFLPSDPNNAKTSYAVHPSGDIYFLGYDSDAVYLYRIKNVWDAQGRETWYALHGGETGAEQLSTKLGLLNDSRVRFRTEPNLTSETLGFLNKGDRVLVLEQSADKMQIGDMNDYWYRIRTPEGTEGWTYGYFIDVRE